MPDVLHTFRRGHRLMVQVQSSWFPLVNMNPQTFGKISEATEAAFQKATQRVWRTSASPSAIRLSVLAPEPGPRPAPAKSTAPDAAAPTRRRHKKDEAGASEAARRRKAWRFHADTPIRKTGLTASRPGGPSSFTFDHHEQRTSTLSQPTSSASTSSSGSAVASVTGRRRVPPAVNEPIRSYAPGTPERAELKARLDVDGHRARRDPRRDRRQAHHARATPRSP